ncbi:transmembrane protein 243-like [Sycon ciliatum]|uniref:transmembrane protein 243-like n=1 Tax=Sycon ciliatum TaxID=27933 RepID=UPI0020AB2B97|eukprot:scpid86382/ scgid12787/ Transmembrane protein C7orf23
MRGGDHPDDNEPLFGETKRSDRIIQYVLTGAVTFMVLFTVASAFFYFDNKAKGEKVPITNIFYALSLMLIVIGQIVMIIWYREGDLDPKFRRFIYFNAFTTILLCIAGNLFFHLPFAGDCDPCTCPTQPPTAPPTT